MLNTPVVLFLFNRPECVRQVFESIRAQQPRKLYLIADGARPNVETDPDLVEAARRVVENVDWKCELSCDFSSRNLGLKKRISSGLNLVFKQESRAIILEDDCVPHPDFFYFCEFMLEAFAEKKEVSVVSGSNFQRGVTRGDSAYYFSKYNHCWGWATWADRWQLFDAELPFLETLLSSDYWVELHPDQTEREYWAEIFARCKRGEINSWAYPWTASVWNARGCTVTPQTNLVSNVGFDDSATHTKGFNRKISALPTSEIGEISLSPEMVVNVEADRHVYLNKFGGRNRVFPLKYLRPPLVIARGWFKNLRNGLLRCMQQ